MSMLRAIGIGLIVGGLLSYIGFVLVSDLTAADVVRDMLILNVLGLIASVGLVIKSPRQDRLAMAVFATCTMIGLSAPCVWRLRNL